MKDTIRYIDLFAGLADFAIVLTNMAVSVYSVQKLMSIVAKFIGKTMAIFRMAILQKFQRMIFLILTYCVLVFLVNLFSICGRKLGFEDTRGTLFFDICRIINAKKPSVVSF